MKKKNLKISDAIETEEEENTLLNSLTPLQKGAILLSALGKEATKSIFKNLKDNDIKKIVGQMSTIEKAPHSVVKLILQEFFSQISEEKELLFDRQNNFHFIQEVLQSGATLDALEFIDNQTLGQFLIHEHPQTVAIILVHLDPVRKSDVFSRLPEGLQAEIITRMGRLDPISPSHLHQLNEVLKRELVQVGPRQQKRLGGTKDVAQLLNSLDKAAQEKILENLNQKDSSLADEIKNQMLVFEDLILADDRGMKNLIPQIEGKTWALALKLASEEIKKKIFQNMSQRAASMLQEDISVLGPTRRSLIEGAQQQILDKVTALQSQGKFFLIRGEGGGDPLV